MTVVKIPAEDNVYMCVLVSVIIGRKVSAALPAAEGRNCAKCAPSHLHAEMA